MCVFWLNFGPRAACFAHDVVASERNSLRLRAGASRFRPGGIDDLVVIFPGCYPLRTSLLLEALTSRTLAMSGNNRGLEALTWATTRHRNVVRWSPEPRARTEWGDMNASPTGMMTPRNARAPP